MTRPGEPKKWGQMGRRRADVPWSAPTARVARAPLSPPRELLDRELYGFSALLGPVRAPSAAPPDGSAAASESDIVVQRPVEELSRVLWWRSARCCCRSWSAASMTTCSVAILVRTRKCVRRIGHRFEPAAFGERRTWRKVRLPLLGHAHLASDVLDGREAVARGQESRPARRIRRPGAPPDYAASASPGASASAAPLPLAASAVSRAASSASLPSSSSWNANSSPMRCR